VSSALTINQWIPAAHRGDAVGDNARAVRDFLRRIGHNSEIYAMTIDENMTGEALPWRDTSSTAGDVTIYHYGVPSPMYELFGLLQGGLVM
jgi:hypothetical protein